MKIFLFGGDVVDDDLIWIILGIGEVSFDWSVCDVYLRKLYRYWI